MLDLIGAQAAAATLLGSGDLDNPDIAPMNLAMVGDKAEWQNQIIGLYDLLFPYMHEDYALRTETNRALTASFKNHHRSWAHNGKKSRNMLFANDAVPTDFEEFRQVFVGLVGKARTGSPVNAIGYGLEGVPI